MTRMTTPCHSEQPDNNSGETTVEKKQFTITLTASRPEYVLLLTNEVIQMLQEVLEYGEIAGKDSWGQPPEFHINKAIRHLDLLKYGDKSEDHLAHAFTRCYMLAAKFKAAQLSEKIFGGKTGTSENMLDSFHSLVDTLNLAALAQIEAEKDITEEARNQIETPWYPVVGTDEEITSEEIEEKTSEKIPN